MTDLDDDDDREAAWYAAAHRNHRRALWQARLQRVPCLRLLMRAWRALKAK